MNELLNKVNKFLDRKLGKTSSSEDSHNERIHLAAVLEEMSATNGYKVLSKKMDERLESLKATLIHGEFKKQKILEAREQIKAIEYWLGFVKKSIVDGVTSRKALLQIAESDRMRKEKKRNRLF